MDGRLAVSVSQAARLLSLGRTRTWTLVRSGRLRTVRVGRRVLVPLKELERFLERELEAQGGDGHGQKR